MHTTAEDIIVEIVDRDGRRVPAGEAGEVVVTHLATADFPFVRYRTGDIAELDEQACPCGRGLPVLGRIHGRSTDFVVAADGTVMHGLALIYVIRDKPGIKQFKIIQESLDHTRVLLVPNGGFDETLAASIGREMRERLGAHVRVDVATVAEIPPERSGKYRHIVSRVSPTPAGGA
jgi:phenylacetate-CoA ligase